MTNIKSYTNLEQSKKLAEFLPLESADMHWSKDFDGSWFADLAEYTSVKIPKYVGNIEEHLLPCWSLSALLDVYPMVVGRDMGMYCCWQNSKHLYSRHYDNPIDACYEMILKLNEQNLL